MRSLPFARTFTSVVSAVTVPSAAEEVDAACERVGDGLEHEERGARPVDVDRGAGLRRRRHASTRRSSVRPEVLRRDATRDREQLSPLVTAALSAAATSSAPSSWPSR